MTEEYSLEVYKNLENEFNQLALHRPMCFERYEIGTELAYDITTVGSALETKVRLIIKKFVGGGFAGQVYQVEITDIDPATGTIDSLKVGGVYAMKTGSVFRGRFNSRSTLPQHVPVPCGRNSSAGEPGSNLAPRARWWTFMQHLSIRPWAVAEN